MPLPLDLDVAALSVDDAAALLGRIEILRAQILARLVPATAPAPVTEPTHPLTCREVAERRGLSTKVVRFLARTGRVPSVRHGRRHLVRLVDVDTYLSESRARRVALGVLPGVSCHHDTSRRPPHSRRAPVHPTTTR